MNDRNNITSAEDEDEGVETNGPPDSLDEPINNDSGVQSASERNSSGVSKQRHPCFQISF